MKLLFSLLLSCVGLMGLAQLPPSPDSAHLLYINQRIDNMVMSRQTNILDSLFASDFVFSHGSGRIEGKNRWLQSVARNTYPVRRHDSATVQQHGNLAVVRGQMYIERVDKTATAKYHLKYIRVFANRTGWWQLVSHTTTHEVHL